MSESQHLSWNAKALRLLDSLAGPDIVRVSPRERMCRDGACIVQVDGTPLHFDAQHLSVHGAEYLVPLFEDLF